MARSLRQVEPRVGRRLSEYRQDMGLSQKQAASQYSCHLNTWQRVEAGERAPDGFLLEQLAKAGLNINWLMTGEGSMVRQKSVVNEGDKTLSPEERMLLENYRALGKASRAHAREVIGAFASMTYKKDKTG